jgi:hypothetical protein
MSRPSRPRNSRRRVLISLVAWLAGCSQTDVSHGKEQFMTTIPTTLWETIAALERQMPISKEAVEAIFQVPLVEIDRSEYFVTLATKQAVAVLDGLTITAVSMMLRPTMQFDEKSGLSLELSGQCVSLNIVRKQYGELELTQPPRGRSLEETATWSTGRPWGVLSFGFRQDRPDCLFRVTLRRKAA